MSAVSMLPVVRYICHFLIVWLTLLSGGAHAIADARHEASHAAVVVTVTEAANVSVGATAAANKAVESTTHDVTTEQAHPETCGDSHCGHGHATGMLATVHTCPANATRDAVLTLQGPWASGDLPPNIARPKWSFTTPAVVNL